MSDLYRVRQRAERGRTDRDAACAVLDAGLVCHVGFVAAGEPFVIPMLYVRDGDRLLLHGAVASRLMRGLAAGMPVCATVTHLDGLVLAASAFHHSANYRSVAVFGNARLIEDSEAKARALDRLVEGLVPGRGRDARAADPRELNATTVVELPLRRFSVKSRSGGSGTPGAKDPRDVWTGVVPLSTVAGEPIPDGAACELPDYLRDYRPGAALPCRSG